MRRNFVYEIINLEQGTEEWLAFRREHIGASDAAAVLGIDPWKGPQALLEEKLSLRTVPSNPHMLRGKQLEEPARDVYVRKTGYKVKPVVIKSKEYPWMIASLDGITEDFKHGVEIKCPSPGSFEKALAGIVPQNYMAQLQHQMACCGLDFIDYFCYTPTSDVTLRVQRNDEYIKKLIERELEFYECMTFRKGPEVLEKRLLQMESEAWEQNCKNVVIPIMKRKEELLHELSSIEEQEKAFKSTLVELSGNQSASGAGVTLLKQERRGTIDYESIPELRGVDLEKYRKKTITFWKLRLE